MKTEHSRSWRSSTQPRKQRKYQYNAPKHLAGHFLSVHLSKELRQKHGTRALRVRTGDKVKVLRGTYRGREGKVESIDLKHRTVVVSKVEAIKKEGGKAPYPLHPSNLLLVELVADKRRLKRSADGKTPKRAAPKMEKMISEATSAPAGAKRKNEE